MSKFNQSRPSQPTKTVNLAGGEAYQQSPELELVSILLTSFVEDKTYRTAEEELDRVRSLLDKVDPVFAAQAAVFARNEYGMRSISHVIAAELARRVKGQGWTRHFVNAVIRRPDDASEILAYYFAKEGRLHASGKKRGIPAMLRKGIAAAQERFDGYQLAKYRGEGKDWKQVDMTNLVHPAATAPLSQLVQGSLAPAETWENKISRAGEVQAKEGQTREEAVKVAKMTGWQELIENRKIGQLALLRNLRNIAEQAPHSLKPALKLLLDPERIDSSLIFPYRYLVAMAEFENAFPGQYLEVIVALTQAVELAFRHLPEMEGKTAIFLDGSGSMFPHAGFRSGGVYPRSLGGMGGKYLFRPAKLFAAVLAKKYMADVYIFSTDARRATYNPMDSLSTIADGFENLAQRGGTSFSVSFNLARQLGIAYDRIFILSDEQGWVGHKAPTGALRSYEAATGSRPRIYSVDLAGYGTTQIPESRVYALAGFSEKMFDLLASMETDRLALLNKIRQVKFEPVQRRRPPKKLAGATVSGRFSGTEENPENTPRQTAMPQTFGLPYGQGEQE